jgi:predicted RNA-binding Zn-ribbon protein involved in translation (DUF1610 family)
VRRKKSPDPRTLRLRELARKGGQASTPKKRLACLRNLAAIAMARPPQTCPACGSTHTRAYDARRGSSTWYHKCLEPDCGFRFKSVEIIVRGLPPDMPVPAAHALRH